MESPHPHGGEFSDQAQTFIPRRLNPSIVEGLQLPVAPLQQCGAPEQILADLVATVGRYFPLPGDALPLIAHYVLATWLSDELLGFRRRGMKV